MEYGNGTRCRLGCFDRRSAKRSEQLQWTHSSRRVREMELQFEGQTDPSRFSTQLYYAPFIKVKNTI